MEIWLIVSIVLCLKCTVPVSGRHRHGLLSECSKCSPGELMVRRCTRYHDSKCTTCPLGSYQPHHSYKRQCYLCSRCGDGLYTAHPCTSTSDTVCDSCHTYKGPHNLDYYHRCQAEELQDFRKATQSVSENLKDFKYHPPSAVAIESATTDYNKQRSLLILCIAITSLFVCCFVLFLLANRWCRNDKKMMKPSYQMVNTEEPVIL